MKHIRAILYYVALVGFSRCFFLFISAENYLQCHVTASKMNLLIQGNKPIFDRTSIIDTLEKDRREKKKLQIFRQINEV